MLPLAQLGSGQQEEDRHKGTIRHRLAQLFILSRRYSAYFCSPISLQLFAEGLTWEGRVVAARLARQEVGAAGCDMRALQLGSTQEDFLGGKDFAEGLSPGCSEVRLLNTKRHLQQGGAATFRCLC